MAPGPQHIDKLDFDSSRRPLLEGEQSGPSPGASHASSLSGSFFEHVAEGIQERDRERLREQFVRFGSFAIAVLSW
jgi:hypothetical protein